MLKRVITFLLIYVNFLLLFIIGKIFFMAFHFDIYRDAGFSNWLSIIGHGLLMDLSAAGYLTVLPGIFLMFSVWMRNRVTRKYFNVYFVILSIILSIIFIADPVLFGYWGVHLDDTVFFYMKNPKNVFANVTTWEIILGITGILICFVGILVGYKYLIDKRIQTYKFPKNPLVATLLLLIMTGLLFIPIRGGFTVSTMNIGKAYFSSNSYYNQAAINPYFNFIYSITKTENFATQFQFMPNDDMQKVMQQLSDKPATDSIPQLLNNQRPNIILFVLEGFGSVVVEPLNGLEDVTPNLTKFCQEGILFSQFYANSFRTDRGLVSILSGYPAQAMTSIMKYPNKTNSLPAIPKTLGKNGYSRELIYGGDIDFTNMRSYFFGCCNFEGITSDNYFPLKTRMSKWGVPDHIVIDTLTRQMQQPNIPQPFFKMVLTLSSHEPFQVPFNKFEDPYLNSVAYADSCLGDFVEKFKKTPYWDNTLIILVPDHAPGYPPKIEIFNPERYRIPLIWTGGAVKQPLVINQIGSQMDLAAILFSQMHIPYDDFSFSKNIVNPATPQFAYYSYNNGFAFIDANGTVVYDNNANKMLVQTEINADSLLLKGKAFTQHSYIDFENRR